MNYVLYHANCYDGFGAAFAAWLHLSQTDPNVIYTPVSYGQLPPKLEPGSVVYILDFSYPAKVLLETAHEQIKVVVLDHHATAEKDLSMDAFMECLCVSKDDLRADPNLNTNGFMFVQNIQLKFDMEKSGAMLAWEYFHPNKPAPLLIQYLQDRDLWLFKMDRSRAMSAYLQITEMDFETWKHIMAKMEAAPEELEAALIAGESCLRLKNQMVMTMCKNARLMVFDISATPPSISPKLSHTCIGTAFEVPVANATVFFSEVGEKLLELYPAAKFAAYYMDRADGKRQWGMRSRDDFDCSIVAKLFGGGGHKRASGFVQTLPTDMFILKA